MIPASYFLAFLFLFICALVFLGVIAIALISIDGSLGRIADSQRTIASVESWYQAQDEICSGEDYGLDDDDSDDDDDDGEEWRRASRR